MNKYTKLFSLAAIPVALLWACNDAPESVSIQDSSDEGAVSFTHSIETRVMDNAFEQGDLIYVQSYSSSGSVLGQCGEYSYADGLFSVVNVDDEINLSTGEALSYLAMYPTQDNSGQNPAYLAGGFAFTVSADQSSAEAHSLSQLMIGAAQSTSSNRPELKFVNQLSKISLSVMVDFEPITASQFSAEFLLKAEALVNYGAGIVSEGSGDAIAITPYINGDCADVVVAPQTLTTGAQIATITYNATPYYWTIDSDSKMASGTNYEYTIFIDTTLATATAVHSTDVDLYLALNYNGDGEAPAAAAFAVKTGSVDNSVGASGTISFTTNQMIAFATTTADWLDVSTSVTGNAGVLTFTATAKNETLEQRSADIMVTVGTGDNTYSVNVTITQDGVEGVDITELEYGVII